MNLQEELKKIEDFVNTPIQERPRYKEFYEQVKKIAEDTQATAYEPKWMKESYVWMANRPTLERIQQEESRQYTEIANHKTAKLFADLEYENLPEPKPHKGYFMCEKLKHVSSLVI